MRPRTVLPLLLLAAVVAGALAAPVAQAHASASRTVPEHLGGLPEAPAVVKVRFSEPLVASQTFIGIFDEQLLRRDLGNTNLSLEPGDARVLVIPTGHLTRGLYTISYETTSAKDGHKETGSLAMSIAVPCPQCLVPPQPSWSDWAPSDSVLAVAAYAAVAVLLGEAALRALVGQRRGGVLRAAVLGAGAVAQAVRSADATSPSQPLAAAAAFLVGLWALRTAGSPRSRDPRDAFLPAVLGLAALVAIVQGGHSSGSGAWLALLHAAPLLAWVGSLPGLAGWLRAGGDEAGLRRYSKAASAALVILAGTAALLSVRRLTTGLDLGAPYVVAWGLKLTAALVLLALAALNHRVLWRGRAARPAADLANVARGVRREAVVGLAVVLLTGLLVALPPPVASSTESFTQAAWHGDTRVALTISPGDPDGTLLPGDHVHEVRLWDLDGHAIRGADVRLAFHHGTLDIGTIEATLESDGVRYWDEGTYLGALGPWAIDVYFRLPGAPLGEEQRVQFDVALGSITHFHGAANLRDPHFDTGYLAEGGAYSIVFTQDRAGTYNVHCHPHPWMQMLLTVAANATVSGETTVQILGDVDDPASAMRFVPDVLVVQPGTTVRFVNEGDVSHTATNVKWTAPASPSS